MQSNMLTQPVATGAPGIYNQTLQSQALQTQALQTQALQNQALQNQFQQQVALQQVKYYILSPARERSGKVLDSRPRGRGFEPHRRHCVVIVEQDTFILAEYWFNPGRPVPV